MILFIILGILFAAQIVTIARKRQLLRLYICVPMAAALFMILYTVFTGQKEFSDAAVMEKYFVKLLLYGAGLLIICILSLVGCIRGMAEMPQDTGEGLFAGYASPVLLRASRLSAVLSVGAGVLSAVLSVIAAVKIAGIMSSFIIAYIAASVVLGIMTMGIGTVVMIVIAPYILITAVLTAGGGSLDLLFSASVSGIAFFALHIFGMLFSISALRAICKKGDMTRKKAVFYGVLSALPVANIIIPSRLLGSGALQ